jgi:hypothetical protein
LPGHVCLCLFHSRRFIPKLPLILSLSIRRKRKGWKLLFLSFPFFCIVFFSSRTQSLGPTMANIINQLNEQILGTRSTLSLVGLSYNKSSVNSRGSSVWAWIEWEVGTLSKSNHVTIRVYRSGLWHYWVTRLYRYDLFN